MALGWLWRSIDSRGHWTLPKFIDLMNVRMNSLADKLSSLFSSIESVDTFASGAATPTIYGHSMWKTNNPVPVTITNFLDGTPGKEFTLWAGDANTTVKNNANIVTKSGADIVMTATDVRRFVTAAGTVWREN